MKGDCMDHVSGKCHCPFSRMSETFAKGSISLLWRKEMDVSKIKGAPHHDSVQKLMELPWPIIQLFLLVRRLYSLLIPCQTGKNIWCFIMSNLLRVLHFKIIAQGLSEIIMSQHNFMLVASFRAMGDLKPTPSSLIGVQKKFKAMLSIILLLSQNS